MNLPTRTPLPKGLSPEEEQIRRREQRLSMECTSFAPSVTFDSLSAEDKAEIVTERARWFEDCALALGQSTRGPIQLDIGDVETARELLSRLPVDIARRVAIPRLGIGPECGL